MSELLPCAHCGCKVRIISRIIGGAGEEFRWKCEACGTKSKWYATRAAAELAANTRHPAPSSDALRVQAILNGWDPGRETTESVSQRIAAALRAPAGEPEDDEVAAVRIANALPLDWRKLSVMDVATIAAKATRQPSPPQEGKVAWRCRACGQEWYSKPISHLDCRGPIEKIEPSSEAQEGKISGLTPGGSCREVKSSSGEGEGMITGALRGYKGKRLHASFAEGPLEIKGLFYMQGPQVVGGEGGVPKYISRLFDDDPTLMRVSFERKINNREVSVIYTRMSDEAKPSSGESVTSVYICEICGYEGITSEHKCRSPK